MSSVLTDLKDGVFRILLNHPHLHNALDEDMIEGLHGALETARQSGCRVVVLEGKGRSFCAGADIDWMRRQGEASKADNELSAQRLSSLYEAIDTLDLPVIGRVHGAAIGGGLGLVAVSDIAVASSRSHFALPEVRLGLLPAIIAPYVARKIGLSVSRDLMLTGRRVDASEAHRIGLVHRVVNEDQIDEAVSEVVDDLKAGGPEAIGHTKRLLRRLPGLLAENAADLARQTADEIARARSSQEGREGTQAFLQKKQPPWLKS